MENIGVCYRAQIGESLINKVFKKVIFPFIGFCLLGLILYSLDGPQLPDFDSYYVMYYEGANLGTSYLGFYKLCLFLQMLGFDYQEFRLLILTTGLVFAYFVLSIRRNACPYYGYRRGIFLEKSIALLILICVFIFEFYVIRLRAGISIFFFVLFFYVWQCSRNYSVNQFLKCALLLCALLSSAVIHFDTFIVITLFVGPAGVWSRYIKLRGALNEFLYLALCLGIWLALFWFGITSSLEGRGPDLASKLNPVRFIMISILPMLIWMLPKRLNSEVKNMPLRKKSLAYFYALNYVSSAIALFTYYYFSPEADIAGEAIVRVMTLSSFGAIMSLALEGISYRNVIALYILIVNSLFFLNTVYG